ncbi:hypothetical protein ACN47E_003396 [Coniothyrium glycines]
MLIQQHNIDARPGIELTLDSMEERMPLPCIKIEENETIPRAVQRGYAPAGARSLDEMYGFNDMVLGTFYNVLPRLPTDDIKQALHAAERLTSIANDLDCLHLLRSHLNATLLKYHKALYNSIFADPAR